VFEGLLQPMHLLVILAIAVFVFGPKKLPELGKGLGEAIRGFKDSMKTAEEVPAERLAAESHSKSANGTVKTDTPPNPGG
jgi:sec-independent protein translocase protein TatA